MKRLDQTMEQVKEQIRKMERDEELDDITEYRLYNRFKKEYFLHYDFPLETPQKKEFDGDGFFLLHAKDGFVVLPYYWANSDDVEMEKYIMEASIQKVEVNIASQMEILQERLKEKEEGLQKAIDSQRLRKLVSGK